MCTSHPAFRRPILLETVSELWVRAPGHVDQGRWATSQGLSKVASERWGLNQALTLRRDLRGTGEPGESGSTWGKDIP